MKSLICIIIVDWFLIEESLFMVWNCTGVWIFNIMRLDFNISVSWVLSAIDMIQTKFNVWDNWFGKRVRWTKIKFVKNVGRMISSIFNQWVFIKSNVNWFLTELSWKIKNFDAFFSSFRFTWISEKESFMYILLRNLNVDRSDSIYSRHT